MRSSRAIRMAFACLVAAAVPTGAIAWAQEGSDEHHLLRGLEPLMIDITDRLAPTNEEWESLGSDMHRGAFGSLSDFRSKTIAFMNTRYFTNNPADGTLASYGKMGTDKRYDRMGHIRGVQFSVEHNSWKQRHVLNAAALFNLAGSRFMEFAGVNVGAAVDSNRQIEVTFIGTTVPKDEAIRNLNYDIEALEYLDQVHGQWAEHQKQSVKLFGTAPPAPKVVLSNVMMLDGRFATALDACADGKLHSRILGDGVELKVTQKNGEEITLLSPVVRCYRTYSIEFRKDSGKQLQRVELRDRQGRSHHVPQVFDLTPDL